MKFYETHYEDYCKSYEKFQELQVSESDLVSSTVPCDMIVYGPSGVGKYSKVLSILKPYSPSQLKYDKKIKASTDKQSYIYRISDIHYEIDMSLLGCNSKIIWHEIYGQIVDIITIKPEKMGFIVCKNFHAIHNELLEIFYSYMQRHCYGYEGRSREVQIHFILITEHYSFLPNNIVNHCQLVRVPRPSHQDMKLFSQIYKPDTLTDIEPILNTLATEDIINLKEIYSFSMIQCPEDIPLDHFNRVCDNIIREMMALFPHFNIPADECSPPLLPAMNSSETSPTKKVSECNVGTLPETEPVVTTNLTNFRDGLYDILIYNLDGIECIWYIFQYFIQNQWIRDTPEDTSRIIRLMHKMSTIFKQYGNNYRSIFHLEHAVFSMMNVFSKPPPPSDQE